LPRLADPRISGIHAGERQYNERTPQPRDITTAYRFFASTGYDLASLEPDSDIYAFSVDRIISVTPLALDLTARSLSASWLTSPEQS
jgi:broad specificity polyphosphatase/5'/3'-nucleotidase SurE